MAAKTSSIRVTFKGVDKLSPTLGKLTRAFPKLTRKVGNTLTKFKIMQRRTEALRRSFGRLGKKMRGVGRSMTAGITAPIALAGAGILRMAVRFDKAMNRVGALTGQLSTKTGPTALFKELRMEAKRLGETTAFSAGEVGTAMGFLAQAGFKTKEILGAIGPTLNLAAAGNLDLATTADIASNIMGAFNIKAAEMVRVSDVLAVVSAKTNVNIQQLGESMKDAAPIAKEFGLSFEETSSIVGFLGNIGIQGTKAGTTLKAMMTKLVAPSSRATKMMKVMGVSVSDAQGKLKSMTNILAELQPQLAKLPQAARLDAINELFGLRGIAGAANLLNKAMEKGPDSMRGFTEALKNSKGAAEEMAKVMLLGAPGAIKKMTSAFEGMAISIANSGLLDMFVEVVQELTGIFQAVAKANPKFLKWATILALVAAAAGPVIFGIGAIASAVSFLLPILSAIGTVLGAVLAFLTWPIALVIAAVLGLIAVWHFFGDQIKLAIGSAIDWVVAKFLKLVNFLTTGIVGKVLNFATGGFSGLAGAGLNAFLGPSAGASNTASGAIKNSTQTNNASIDVLVSSSQNSSAIATPRGGDGFMTLINNGAMGGI